MVRRVAIAVLVGAGALLFFLTPTGEAVSQAVREVFVVNFPAVQRVEGDVRLTGPVSLARSVRFEDVTVPPVRRQDTTRFVDAGVLETEGFPDVVLSLHGVVKGDVAKPGAVGVILLPDEPTIQEAFAELGLTHFHIETAASEVTSRTPYFASEQSRFDVAFARYRVLLYNDTDKTVTANLYAYLTN